MKDPAPAEAPRRRSKIASPTPSLPAGTHPLSVAAVGDPATLVGEGFEGGIENRFRKTHTSVTQKTCAACREDLGAPDLNYRLILRCSTHPNDV